MASVDERLKKLEAASKEVDPFAGILVEYNAEVLVRLLDLKGKMIAQGAGGGPAGAACGVGRLAAARGGDGRGAACRTLAAAHP